MAVLNAPLIRSRPNMTQNFALSVRVSIRAISHLQNVARTSMKCQKESCKHSHSSDSDELHIHLARE